MNCLHKLKNLERLLIQKGRKQIYWSQYIMIFVMVIMSWLEVVRDILYFFLWFSRYCYVCLNNSKSELFDKFNIFKADVEK